MADDSGYIETAASSDETSSESKELKQKYDLMRKLQLASLPQRRDRFGNLITPESQFGGGLEGSLRYPDLQGGGYGMSYKQVADALGHDPEVFARSGGLIGRGGPAVAASRNMRLIDVLQQQNVEPSEARDISGKATVETPKEKPGSRTVTTSTPAVGNRPWAYPKDMTKYTKETALLNRMPEIANMFEIFKEVQGASDLVKQLFA